MNKVVIIADIGQAHEGSVGMAHSYIDALANTGVDIVKFQTHIAEAESSLEEPFRVDFSFEDNTRYDYWKRMEFTPDQWDGIKKHCDEVGLEFMSTPSCLAAVDLLEKVDIKRYKVGSGDLTNLLLLRKIAKTGKPIILSIGLGSYSELDRTIDFLKSYGNPVSILQCTSAYPTKPEQLGLNVMGEMKKRYDKTIGYSDHSGEIFACLMAAALGANILEFHVVFDKRIFGPDSKASLTIDEIKKLVDGVRKISMFLQHPVDKTDSSTFQDLKNIFEKSLSVNNHLKRGHIISFDDLESKKPSGMGISPSQFEEVLGKELNKDKNKFDFLKYEDLKK